LAKLSARGKQAATGAKADRALIQRIEQGLAKSLLPGEPEPSGEELADAAAFLLEAMQHRAEGAEALLLRTAVSGKRRMQVAVVNRDMPFLVDSVAGCFAAHGVPIDRLIHPVMPVRRDAEGNLAALPDEAGDDEVRESIIYIETPRIDARQRRALEAELKAALAHVRVAVADWPKMRQALAQDAERLGDSEGGELLRWLSREMLTHLGHVTRRRDGGHAQIMGICRKGARDLLGDEAWRRAFAWFDAEGSAPLIVKANRESLVHRRVPIDLFIVPLLEDGRVAALSVHAGIWTSAGLAAPPAEVPVLRQDLAAIMAQFGFSPTSHDGKALAHALTALPHDIVIGLPEPDICRLSTAMMALVDRPRPRCAIVAAPLKRHLFAFVWLPRDLMSTRVRLQVQELLEEETGAKSLDWSMASEGDNLATLRFMLDNRDGLEDCDSQRIDARLQEILRGWTEAVETALRAVEEEGRAAALAARYAELFPASYRTAYGAAEAARDIARIRHLQGGAEDCPLGRDVRLYRMDSDPADQLRLKIYQQGGWMPLSDAVPALENFGFRVLAETPNELAGEGHGAIHDFRLSLPAGVAGDSLLERAEAIEAAARAVINGLAEDDVFNRLVLVTGLAAQEADWMRAIYRYLRQIGVTFTIYTVVDALNGAPDVTRGIIDLFRTRHDPDFAGDRAEAVEQAEAAIRAGLANVAAINDDRLLRLYQSVVSAILRTNAFAPSGAEALAFKIDSALVPGVPRPVPWREIFVYSRRVEGVHLRAGPVARGGIRWSDRRDDFRTEILGLMKAQRVKNAVIVPTGAKGGFYPKRLPNPAEDRDAWFAEGRDSYRLFIRTLLSVTDNIRRNKLVHPDRVVIHDGDDPYFVVAADKGTASFSDTANAIAEDRDFWLGDAFASGGSHGYDHKAMGITARGAWISVQRHFRELGVDVQSQPVRVAGCGDMSGDVFGNGMLLSRAIKLVAAFDHRHIFIDPDPDPKAAWKERKRLFELPRSSWADYDTAKISAGGGVFPRTMKQIELSPQIGMALGLEGDAIDPDSLIRAILAASVDLLWFGGIGTYIKAGNEVNAEVGDPANDTLRINGEQVRARVIGEGANLGVTQAGRIEFALGGGRVNTDFIDNSAGVDCSDNEVNIKIALASARRAGRITEQERNALLIEMTDEVAELVLEDNRLQTLALSIAERGGANAVPSHIRLIETLEGLGELDRHTEGLPENAALARRASDNQGLTRPELAVLLSNAKLVLQDAVETGELADDEMAVPLLLGDFPARMHEPFRKDILKHRLRREIVGTVAANEVVNRIGLLHPFELAEEEGAPLEQVAAAFVTVSALLDMPAVWEAIEKGEMAEQARLLLFEQAALAMRSHMADLLRAGLNGEGPAAHVAALSPGVEALHDNVDVLLSREAREHAEAIVAMLVEGGAPIRVAGKVANVFALDGAIGIAHLARGCGIEPMPLARAFIALGSVLGLDWAQSRAALMSPSDPWERLLVAGLARDFQQMRLDFLRQLTRNGRSKADPVQLVEEWGGRHDRAIVQFRSVVARAHAATPLTSAMLAQIAGQARSLLQRCAA